MPIRECRTGAIFTKVAAEKSPRSGGSTRANELLGELFVKPGRTSANARRYLALALLDGFESAGEDSITLSAWLRFLAARSCKGAV